MRNKGLKNKNKQRELQGIQQQKKSKETTRYSIRINNKNKSIKETNR